MERIARTRTNKTTKVSGGMVQDRSQKSSEGQKATLEVEIHPDPALDENRAGRGTEGNENVRLALEFTPVEKGPKFATSTGLLIERRFRNCPTSLLKTWRLHYHQLITL